MRSRVRGRAVAAGVLSLSLGGLLLASAGPAVAQFNSQVTLPFTGLNDPSGVAVDAAGDVYVTDPGNNRVVDLPAGATSPSQQVTLPLTVNFNNPFGVAVDAAGDVYVAVTGINEVVELPAGATSSSQQVTLPFTGLADPNGVAVDAAGDVYVADTGNSRVVELPAGSSQQVTLPFTGLNNPFGVAVDKAGDVYVADTVNSRVVELPAGATSSGQQITLPFTGLDSPFGLAVDAAGDVYVADTGNDRVVELPAGATSSSQQVTLPFAGLSDPDGVAVDKAGDVYVADSLNDRVVGLAALTPLAVTTTSLPGGQVGAAYSQTLAAAGGTAPYTWSVASGSLPAGLSLSTAGVISGTLTARGSSSFTVQAADSSTPQMTATQALSIMVSPTMTDFAVPTAGAGLGEITAGPDGNLWFLENPEEGDAAQIGKITTGGTLTEYGFPQGSRACCMTLPEPVI